ncbi:MAG: A/G-specific adenine glycosylase [Acidiphilium sp. 37-64-53]|uniref:A/G-specific adenine glycosylase n=1 Tax=Acidiphilium TaxID=522 RepID=UPI000BD9992D|nr:MULTISPECIES: A/G-specific adenine glycosylase [Acidiphilium]OYV99846.1 MAG: A/G-specific adenine glycosylase [Acidiphilium sp. 37-64-53]HQT86812.1 A/G-specific adenine glycosylase [Acidiphilium rubrum]
MNPAPPSAAALLRWYGTHRRVLPWRATDGGRPDPYHVWLSEIMLQQTVVATVIPYFGRFIERYPTVADLAAAPDDDVLGLWAGLGYYARARNLIACARAVAAAGGFPATIDGLRALPGIGAYTAAAIGAIAFDLPVVPIDGNVERVAARIGAVTTALPAGKAEIARVAAWLGEQAAARAAPGDFAQALFDLGASLCAPRSPSCLICPWRGDCAGHAAGIAATLPRKAARAPRPVRFGTVFLLRDADGAIGLRRRPPKGLLGGMMELPGTVWEAAMPDAPPPVRAVWRDAGVVVHVFTHFELRLRVMAAEVAALPVGLVAAAVDAPLPSLMRKAVSMGLGGLD